MANISVKIEGIDELRRNFERSPETVVRNVHRALLASIAEIDKQTNDGGDSGNFRYKTPRVNRTGYLARSFAFGKEIQALYASIGPTALYAPYVYYGTRTQSANPYMDRIAHAAEPEINRFFGEANELIVQELAKL